MTKDSPKAASLALRSICSAFSRCKSRVSDIEFETPLPVIIRCQNPQVEAGILSDQQAVLWRGRKESELNIAR